MLAALRRSGDRVVELEAVSIERIAIAMSWTAFKIDDARFAREQQLSNGQAVSSYVEEAPAAPSVT